MHRLAVLAALIGTSFANPANAYEYALQFATNYGARGLVVAGYVFKGDTVVGNCSYYVTSGGSGRGGGYHSHTTYYDQTCTWDLYGNLLGTAQGRPVVPTTLSTGGGLTIYARNAQGDVTGSDSASFIGFVNTPSAQYSWITQPNYVFLPDQQPLQITLTLQSRGDYPLIVGKIDPSALLAKALVKSTTCQAAPVAQGASCIIVITYDPSGIPGGDDPYTAYDTMTVGIVSNSGQAPDFSEPIEVPVSPAN